MKITILNKNRINNTGSYEISNLLSFEIDEGFTITENFNETLNSGTIRLSHLTSEIDIQPFDEVLLNGDTRFNDLYFCVDDYECIEESLDTGNKTYTYEITLFSQIKLLEGIILPNLSITPLKSPENRRSVYDYLSLYLNEYGEKIRVNNSWVKRYDFSDNVIDRFSAITCPELQWNAPTLREVLNDLTMVDNCVLTLNNGVLDILDLEQTTGREITNYNYVRKSKSSTDYVSDIRMNLQNALQTSVDNVKNTITTVEMLHFTSDGFQVDTSNLYLKTKYPILNIKSLKMYIPFSNNDGSTTTFRSIDLVSYGLISEYNEYITKQVLYGAYTVGGYYGTWRNYQNFSIFFRRGQNVIDGFNTVSKKFLSITETTINALRSINAEIQARNNLIQQVVADNINNEINAYYSTFFEIEYETTATQTFSAGKGDKQDNYRVIVDNQTNSWVDVNTQSKLEYSKANRLGNESLLINQRYKNSGDLMKIGDKLGDNIVYQTQYQVYSDLINANGLATKNYILKDFFTGINSKIRTWVNAKDEAFERHDLIKYYCELSLNQHTEYAITTTMKASYLLTPIRNYNTIPSLIPNLSNVLIRTYDKDNNKLTGGEFIILDLIARPFQNSLILTCGFDDNAVVDNFVYTSGETFTTNDIATPNNQNSPYINKSFTTFGGIPLMPTKYIDNNFEYDYAFFNFLNGNKINDLINKTSLTSNEVRELMGLSFDLPKVNSEIMENFDIATYYQLWVDRIDLHKDNKEIPQFSFQYEFCCENRDIYFTQLFINRQYAITQNHTTLKVYGSNTYTYGKLVITNEIEQVNATITTTDSGEVNITNVDDYEAYYITDNNNNIIIGVKSLTFYLNILKYRNKNIYNNNKEKIGEI